jgi:hypothetical protein
VALGAVGERDLPVIALTIDVVGLMREAAAGGLDGANGIGG